MQPRIETIPAKKLIGQYVHMTMADNKTRELWQGFMPRRKEIKNAVGNDLISMQIYDPALKMEDFTMQTPVDKWAAAEVNDYNAVPDGMRTFDLPGGLYAVFFYKGAASAGGAMFQYIFAEWLPSSGYTLDNTRPHFEILGAKYKNDDPESEEDIYIPVKRKDGNLTLA
ncbi:GyrI-like domain-containing protein [Chitinophagaceae bacterium MMS25-I14]